MTNDEIDHLLNDMTTMVVPATIRRRVRLLVGRVKALEAHLSLMPSQLMAYKADVRALQARLQVVEDYLKATHGMETRHAELIAKYEALQVEHDRPRMEFAGNDVVCALAPEVDAVLLMIAEACDDERVAEALVTDLSRVSDFPIEGTPLEGDTRYLWQVAIAHMRATIHVLQSAPKRTQS